MFGSFLSSTHSTHSIGTLVTDMGREVGLLGTSHSPNRFAPEALAILSAPLTHDSQSSFLWLLSRLPNRVAFERQDPLGLVFSIPACAKQTIEVRQATLAPVRVFLAKDRQLLLVIFRRIMIRIALLFVLAS